jgi:hypothetical protein
MARRSPTPTSIRPWPRPAPHGLPAGAGEFAVQVFVAGLDLLFQQVRMHG